MPPTVTAASFLEAHETRIHSLESQGVETQAILARLQGDMQHVQESQEESYRDLQQLKAMVAAVGDKTREGFAGVDQGLKALTTRVAELEKVKQESDHAIAAFKRKVLGGIVFVVGGVIGTLSSKFGDAIWQALHK